MATLDIVVYLTMISMMATQLRVLFHRPYMALRGFIICEHFSGNKDVFKLIIK